MNIYATYMIEGFKIGGEKLTIAKARELIDDLDAGKYHCDAWAHLLDMDENRTLTPVYGDIGTDDNHDYCIGFDHIPAEEENNEIFCDVCGHDYPTEDRCQFH